MSQWKKFFVLALVIIALAACGENSTVTSIVTPTSQPTQAPKPAQVSIQDQVQSIAQKSGAYTHADTVTYDAEFKEAYITEAFPVTGDNSLDVPRIKSDALAIQKAAWQAHIDGVDAVMIMFDNDTDQTRLATCLLERSTAATIQWATISPDQAWSACKGWLSPSLS